MSTFYHDLSSQIIASKGYAYASGHLFEAYISKMAIKKCELDNKTIKQLSTSIQFFYRSNNEEYLNEGSIILSMLLHVCGEQSRELIAIADSVFSQSGDFPNVKLLRDKFRGMEFKVSIFDETRKDLREELNTVNEIDHPLTDYQRTLWEDLTSDKDVITSAPTSTGKTDIVLRYLMQKLIESEGAFAAVVVPTRALISEVSRKIYEIAKNKSCEKRIQICTVPKDGPFQDKTFFVMTQERLFEVLQNGDLNFNYLFIDEAHNISDKSRGVLLHLTLQKLLEGSNPQIVISMPSPLYLNAFDSVFEGIRFAKKKTKHSPVAKIIIPVAFKGRNILLSRINSNKTVSIDKQFQGTKLSDIVFRLGKGESNIVYRNQTNQCEDTARNIAALVPEDKGSQALEEAADYVERFLHKDFSLASSLRKGVAFHYGPLPGVVRAMIEDLVREGEIEFIVCTSTLAEGVNLPAKNLFLTNPTQITPKGKKSARLENVKLDNITGRAGRMLEHFAGNIFLIEYSKWDYTDYFEEKEENIDKIPTYFKVINEDLNGIIDALKGNYGHSNDDQYSYYTIANKLLKEFGSDNLSSTLKAKELTLNAKEIKRLEAYIKQAYDALKVDTFTLEANPIVGFIQQNKLYKILLEQSDLTEWTLPHPKSSLLYKRLEKICQVLYEAGIYLPTDDNSIRYTCLIAKKWMTGDPLKSIIARQIYQDSKKGKAYNCNKSVRDVIKVINNDVRFRMSSALRCYHSLLTNIIGSRRMDLQSIKIHSFIEVGGCGDRIISLVNFGFSRETALEIDRVLPKKIDIKSVGVLRELYDDEMLEKLHVITKREIKSLLF
jgi:late competence protein required for DNA uptake (superfamily II DNA/RNA helicase)